MEKVRVWKCYPGSGDPVEVSEEWVGKQVNEIASLLPAGVYTTLRTFNRTQTIRLDLHFSRLEESSSILGGKINVSEFQLRDKMRVAIAQSYFQENRIRIHVPINNREVSAFLLFDNLTTPQPEDYLVGVEVATLRMHRDHAEAKSTEFIRSAEEIRRGQSANINEVIMISEDGSFLEGLSSNFYVVEKGKIWTAQKGVLAGITREIVLEIIENEKFPMINEGFPSVNANRIEEAFLTSTSRGLLPVVKMDNNYVGNGLPGSITAGLRTRFDEKIQQLLETI